jgi:adenylosuccinate lyase
MDQLEQLYAISPLDGRYFNQVSELGSLFSEAAYFQYRYDLELKYLNEIIPLIFSDKKQHKKFSYFLCDSDLLRIKEIEKDTNHDVKAIEYFIRKYVVHDPIYNNYIHFGLTSQDVNNPAITLMFYDFIKKIYYPHIYKLIDCIEQKASNWENIKMLAHTHGQPATPTTLGKEFSIFAHRLKEQVKVLEAIPWTTKFGGAVGTFSAHKVAYPEVDWEEFANGFIQDLRGCIQRQKLTTQIENYDMLSSILNGMKQINVIFLDMCQDIWLYIQMDYLKLKIKESEVGSSTMPHKVNPIDFENAQGNLLMANCIFNMMSCELPISKLQRDLKDSTILRNLGVPTGHTIISMNSIIKGLGKVDVHQEKITIELEEHSEVLAEAIQTILRTCPNISDPYNELKKITRGQKITKMNLDSFVDQLNISPEMKNKIKKLTIYDL